MRHRRFLWYCLATLSLVLGSTAAVNYVVDPYGLFDSPRIDGFNKLKPTAETRVRYTKPYRVAAARPSTVIMGNSRPEIGLDPAYPCWPERYRPVYNLAMLGAGLYPSFRNFQHAASKTKIRYMVLGLDFLFFVQDAEDVDPYRWNPPSRDFEHLRVFADGRENGGYLWQRAVNSFKALFSLQTLVDSIHTLSVQGKTNASTLNRDGHNPGRQFLGIVATEGQRALFDQKNREVARILSGRKYLFQGGQRWSQSFETLRRILDLARRRGTEVTLFINPRHADFLNLLRISGKWQMLEEWKRLLTEVSDRYRVALWDFHGFDEFSTAPVPERVGQVLDGFWEPGHYRSALGNVMIDNMFADSSCNPRERKLGVRLRPDNIEAHLDNLQRQLLRYSKGNPQRTQELRRLFNVFLNTIKTRGS